MDNNKFFTASELEVGDVVYIMKNDYGPGALTGEFLGYLDGNERYFFRIRQDNDFIHSEYGKDVYGFSDSYFLHKKVEKRKDALMNFLNEHLKDLLSKEDIKKSHEDIVQYFWDEYKLDVTP